MNTRCVPAVAGLVVVALLAAPRNSSAGVPRLSFDVADRVSCREVTPPEFAISHPGDKLIEVVFEISALVQSGLERDVVHFLYTIESPEQRLRVADYLPRTELGTSIVGPLVVEKKEGDTVTLGASANGKYEGYVSGNITAARSNASEERVRYEKLPPKSLLAASGTIRRGHGVYFKLKPSEQSSLEGSRQFVLTLQVPRTWRADVMTVRCQAIVRQSGPLAALDPVVISGGREFLVGASMAGDSEAAAAVAEYLEARQGQQLTLAAHGVRTDGGNYLVARRDLKAVRTVARPLLPDALVADWLDKRVEPLSPEATERMPSAVVEADQRLELARRQLSALGGK